MMKMTNISHMICERKTNAIFEMYNAEQVQKFDRKLDLSVEYFSNKKLPLAINIVSW